VFSLANISLGARARAVPRRVARRRLLLRENPFRLTVWLFGGGGSSESRSRRRVPNVLNRPFEFGGRALDFGVSRSIDAWPASISASKTARRSRYFRLRRSRRARNLRLHRAVPRATYEFSSGKATGRPLAIEVEVLFLSFSVESPAEKFKGSNNDPDFVQIARRTARRPRPWDGTAAFADQ
jgi:hypothetical protein